MLSLFMQDHHLPLIIVQMILILILIHLCLWLWMKKMKERSPWLLIMSGGLVAEGDHVH